MREDETEPIYEHKKSISRYFLTVPNLFDSFPVYRMQRQEEDVFFFLCFFCFNHSEQYLLETMAIHAKSDFEKRTQVSSLCNIRNWRLSATVMPLPCVTSFPFLYWPLYVISLCVCVSLFKWNPIIVYIILEND